LELQIDDNIESVGVSKESTLAGLTNVRIYNEKPYDNAQEWTEIASSANDNRTESGKDGVSSISSPGGGWTRVGPKGRSGGRGSARNTGSWQRGLSRGAGRGGPKHEPSVNMKVADKSGDHGKNRENAFVQSTLNHGHVADPSELAKLDQGLNDQKIQDDNSMLVDDRDQEQQGSGHVDGTSGDTRMHTL
jgi:hypothetical protein